jgi:hypothetical protein
MRDARPGIDGPSRANHWKVGELGSPNGLRAGGSARRMAHGVVGAIKKERYEY